MGACSEASSPSRGPCTQGHHNLTRTRETSHIVKKSKQFVRECSSVLRSDVERPEDDVPCQVDRQPELWRVNTEMHDVLP